MGRTGIGGGEDDLLFSFFLFRSEFVSLCSVSCSSSHTHTHKTNKRTSLKPPFPSSSFSFFLIIISIRFIPLPRQNLSEFWVFFFLKGQIKPKNKRKYTGEKKNLLFFRSAVVFRRRKQNATPRKKSKKTMKGGECDEEGPKTE